MDQKAIEKVLRMFEQSSIASMELETDTFKIKLSKTPETAPLLKVETPAQLAQEPLLVSNTQPESWWVNSPLVGTYFGAANPDAKPYVRIGDKVKEGQVLCLVEAMKVMNEIKAHRSGVVLEIKAENGQLVEFNQNLVCIGDV